MSEKDPHLGMVIGSYEIREILGSGGMGTVYLAQQNFIGKQVAIKLLRGEFSSQPVLVERFLREARAVNEIRHENVIDIIDHGKTNDGEYYLLMEYLEGRTLNHAIKKEAPFQNARIGHIGLQICSALAAAHEKNIIHRDLKSDNIFLTTRSGQRDFVKVLDFGIAKLLDSTDNVAQTTTGMVLGTPLYMAPEQALGKPLDAQTDIYALGVILYQMATGQYPFYDVNPVALATMHVTAKLPLPREKNPQIHPRVESVLVRCLEKEKQARYHTMREVAAELARACDIDVAPYFGLYPTTGRFAVVPQPNGKPESAEEASNVTKTGNTNPNTNTANSSSSSASQSMPQTAETENKLEEPLKINIPIQSSAPVNTMSVRKTQTPPARTGLVLFSILLVLAGVGALYFGAFQEEEKPTRKVTKKVRSTTDSVEDSDKQTHNEEIPEEDLTPEQKEIKDLPFELTAQPIVEPDSRKKTTSKTTTKPKIRDGTMKLNFDGN